MVYYRRNKIPGGTYFFTLALRDRRSKMLTDHIGLLRSVMKHVQMKNFYKIHAIVILPEHIHALWELPTDDDNFSMRWRQIKTLFTKSLIKKGIPIKRSIGGGYDLWQYRFWEHTIRDENDFENHVNYIHYNPVKHNLVSSVKDWPYSSFHRYVKNGLLPLNWSVDDEMVARMERSDIRE